MMLKIKCKSCNKTIIVKKDELISFNGHIVCPFCQTSDKNMKVRGNIINDNK